MSKITERAGTAGVTSGDQSVLGKQLSDLEEQLDRWEDKLAQIEERYWRQFTAMEKAIQQMNEQSNMIYSYFFSLGSMGGR
jgi:flagellar hook-associated protein 2